MKIDKNTVVAVTGGTAGVGRAVVREFASAGARVAVLAREPGRLQESSDELTAIGVKCLAIQADVANAAQVEDAADRIERELGPIDVWVNNAMVAVVGDAVVGSRAAGGCGDHLAAGKDRRRPQLRLSVRLGPRRLRGARHSGGVR